ncbi:hypothetical protein BB558_004812 [Smittium angustum]|uniref:Uncharacterized protein n=1 Tax=Smittium angustum TaxID=133377 RepID=A0A2U1IWY9_SMIAN|nr:hypothetical protein BB558_006691 [Smittium angustum]PVZ99178.1 hypothetical protein BB558_004812 [Smittium angustum]
MNQPHITPDSIRDAIQITYSTTTNQQERTNANNLINSTRYSQNSASLGLNLIQNLPQNTPQAKYLGWQLIEDQAKQIGVDNTYTPDQLLKVIKEALSTITQNEKLEYLIHKAAKTTATVALRLWPNGIWSDFPVWIQKNLNNHFLVLYIMKTLCEEVMEYESDPIVAIRKPEYTTGLTIAILPANVFQKLYPHGFKSDGNNPTNTNNLEIIKPIPGNENGWLGAWMAILSDGSMSITIKAAVLSTIQSCLNWMPFIVLKEMPQLLLFLNNSLLESKTLEILKSSLDCLQILTARPYSSPVEKHEVVSLLVEQSKLHLTIHQLFSSLKNQRALFPDLEDSEIIEIKKNAIQVLSNITSNLIWYKKSPGFLPENINDLLLALVEGLASRHVTVSDIGAMGLLAMERHPEVMLTKIEPSILFQLQNICIDKLQWTFQVCSVSADSEFADQTEWENEADGVHFETFVEYKSFISTRYRSKLIDILRLIASLDSINFSKLIIEKVSGLTQPGFTNIEKLESTGERFSLINTGFALIEIVAKDLQTIVSSEKRDLEKNTSIEAAVQLFEILIKYKCNNPEVIRQQLSKLEFFGFLIEKQTNLIRIALEALTTYVSIPEQYPLSEKDDWTKVSYKTASVLQNLIKSNPNLFWNYYFDFVSLAKSKENSVNTPGRTKIMLWELPISFLTTQVPCFGSGAPNEADLKKTIAQLIAPAAEDLVSINQVLENPQMFFDSLGLGFIDNDKNTSEDNWKNVKAQRGVLGSLVQKIFAFAKPLAVITDPNLQSSINSNEETKNVVLPFNYYLETMNSYAPEIMKTTLMLARVLHAGFNNEVAKSSKWKLFIENKFSLEHTIDLESIEYRESSIFLTYIHQLLEYTHKILGYLVVIPSVYSQIGNFGELWTSCLFGEANYLPSTVWKSLLSNTINRCVIANSVPSVYNYPNPKHSLEFFSAFFPHLTGFINAKLGEMWSQFTKVKNDESDISEFEVNLRGLTRTYADLLADLFFSLNNGIQDHGSIEEMLVEKYMKKGSENENTFKSTNMFGVLSADGEMSEESKEKPKLKKNQNILIYIVNNQPFLLQLLNSSTFLLSIEDTFSARKIIKSVEQFVPTIVGIVSFFTPVSNVINDQGFLSNLSIEDFYEFYQKITKQTFNSATKKLIVNEQLFSLFVTITEWASTDLTSLISDISSASKYILNIKSSFTNSMMILMKKHFNYIENSNSVLEYLSNLKNFDRATSGVKENKYIFASTKMLFDKLINISTISDEKLSGVKSSAEMVSQHKEFLGKSKHVSGAALVLEGKKSLNSSVFDSELSGSVDGGFDLGNFIP